MRLLKRIGILLVLLPMTVTAIPCANAADPPLPRDKQSARPSNGGKILAGLEEVCKEQGWGHWWNGTNCLTNAEASRLTKENALDVIRRKFGRNNPLF